MHKTYLVARMQLLYIKLSDTVVWRIDRFANTIWAPSKFRYAQKLFGCVYAIL